MHLDLFQKLMICFAIVMLCLTLFDSKKIAVKRSGRPETRSSFGDWILLKVGFQPQYVNIK